MQTIFFLYRFLLCLSVSSSYFPVALFFIAFSFLYLYLASILILYLEFFRTNSEKFTKRAIFTPTRALELVRAPASNLPVHGSHMKANGQNERQLDFERFILLLLSLHINYSEPLEIASG